MTRAVLALHRRHCRQFLGAVAWLDDVSLALSANEKEGRSIPSDFGILCFVCNVWWLAYRVIDRFVLEMVRDGITRGFLFDADCAFRYRRFRIELTQASQIIAISPNRVHRQHQQ